MENSPETYKDEPITPAGRLFLQPQMNQVINCAIGLKNPMDISAIKSQLSASFLARHPRFTSLLVYDRNGREHWRKTDLDIDQHVVVLDLPLSSLDDGGDDSVNDYLADLAVSCPLSTDKPLWEIHLMLAQNCAVLRFHHALGDGISLMSMFLAGCRRVDDPDAMPSILSSSNGTNRRESRGRTFWEILKMVWFTLIFVLGFIGRALWVSDKRTAVSGGAGVELWPRKLATARFWLEDMKLVKKAVPNATINDVVFGVISLGLARYLDLRSAKALPEGLQITGVAMVNIRPQPGLQELSSLMSGNSKSRWGNKFGIVLLPVYYHKGNADPLFYLRRSKVMLDRKKQSLEAYFSYTIGYFVMSYVGPKVASLLNYRILCNSTFTFSNVIGPKEEITYAGNPITFLRATSCGLPHAITMHMVSYAGRADMQILVAKEIIPDPGLLAKCFEDALLEMKEAAVSTSKS